MLNGLQRKSFETPPCLRLLAGLTSLECYPELHLIPGKQSAER
jgi:hypothetical protein